MTREFGLSIARKALEDRLTFDDSLFEDFEIKTLYKNEVPVGTLFIKGPEIHVAILKEHRKRWLSRSLIKEVLNPIVKKYGHVITAVMEDNYIGRDFVMRLGFVPWTIRDRVIHYIKRPS